MLHPGDAMNVLSAANALRTSPVFANTGVRHLVDLVELAAPRRVVIPFERSRSIRAPFILVTRGRAHARAVGGTFPLGSGDLLWTNQPAFLEPAAARRIERRAGTILSNVRVELTSTAVEGTEVLPLRVGILRSATTASSSFGRSVDLSVVSPGKTTLYDIFRKSRDRLP